MMIQYFGTNLDSAGHFFWQCDGERLRYDSLNISDFFKNKFDLERMCDDKRERRNGDVFFKRIGDYTICYITGSCIDKRHGCKSVFFTTDKVTFGELAIKMMQTPIIRMITEKMPFEIRWGLRQDILEQMNMECFSK